MIPRRLRVIARAVRAEIEDFAKLGNVFCGCLIDLSCYCSIATYLLANVSRRCGFDVSIVEGVFDYDGYCNGPSKEDINHCWVNYKGHIIDITATQFNIKTKVFIVEDSDQRYAPFNQNEAVFQEWKTEWPEDQSPLTYQKELDRRADSLVRRFNRLTSRQESI